MNRREHCVSRQDIHAAFSSRPVISLRETDATRHPHVNLKLGLVRTEFGYVQLRIDNLNTGRSLNIGRQHLALTFGANLHHKVTIILNSILDANRELLDIQHDLRAVLKNPRQRRELVEHADDAHIRDGRAGDVGQHHPPQ